MQPPSYDDFIKQEKSGGKGNSEDATEGSGIEKCPTPGCGCEKITLIFENEEVTGLFCDKGCKFMVKRNAFTGDIVYFALIEYDSSTIPNPESVSGMKFTPLGEPYTDWY